MTEIGPQPQQPPLSGTLLFYSQPEPLNKIVHANLGLKRIDNPYGFVAGANIVPLMVNEFAPAALSYPIIFAGSPRRPAAVLALAPGQSLFVDAKTGFKPEAYVPLYVRRYPFALANDQDNQRMVLVLDRGSELVGENPEMPFFENGEPSKLIDDTIKFCNDFEASRQLTDRFCDHLEELDLFEVRTASFTPRNTDGSEGTAQPIAEFFAIDEKKLNALPTEKLAELRDTGALHQIYAHLISMAGWDRLLAMHFNRTPSTQSVGHA
ncbi:MAG TPA: SapC family protein [Caulobacteraceae bacterium]|jgi:hypothetical protein